MSTGTVSLHSWSDGAEDDGGEPPMGANFNARLESRDGPGYRRAMQERSWGREAGRGLRSNIVRPQRFIDQGNEDDGW